MSDPFSFSQTWRAVVELWPERVAIELPDTRRTITYAELHRIVSGIAEQLVTEGVRKGHLVGLRLADRRRFCVGLLGAWLADAVPVPLSATAPDYYVEAIKQRIGVSSTIVDGDGDNVCMIMEPKSAGTLGQTANLAYVMHTSGSTGKPKAVAMSHRALASYCRAFIQATGLTEHDRFLQLAPVTFDVVFEELLPIWSVGGTAVLSSDTPEDPRRLLSEIETRVITVAEMTTVFWQLLVRYLRRPGVHVPRCLRLLLMGGEIAPPDLIQESLSRDLPLAHVYGVTEAGITTSIAFFDRDEQVSTSWVGQPLSNSAIAIVDQAMKIMPDGEIGEVWIGGEGLAEGYLGDPETTAEHFVDMSVGSSAHARWYRTGDAGRVVNGSLEILGRLDAEVKVNGARVDLTAIEMALSALPMVSNAAVIPLGGPGISTRLVAFVSSDLKTEENLGRRIRDALREKLPSHFVPTRIIVLDALPVTPHGKIDRQKLASMRPHVKPLDMHGATKSQQFVMAAWAVAIGHPPSSLDEGFFEAGGDSLALLSLVVALEEIGITISPDDCLAHPTVRAMADLIDGAIIAGADCSASERSVRRREHLSRRRIGHRSAD
jgi:amino acid adenylation domain-containing protein